MNRNKQTKLNHFMVSAPSGVVLTSVWLEKHSISSKLAWWYVQTGLLERLGSKSYKKAGDNITWVGVVTALQTQLHLPLHVGGKTALELLGRAHFVPMQTPNEIMLFSDVRAILPAWVSKNNWLDTQFRLIKASPLFKSKDKKLGIINQSVNGLSVEMSTPERAIMEVLFLCIEPSSLSDAVLLMENLGQLRPSLVQSLLEYCNSIKVKRLFLYFAENFQHPWSSKLDLTKINLGKGKRVISGGGKYDAKYQLSLPKIMGEWSGF